MTITNLLRYTGLWVILWLLWMGLIFFFSHLPGSATYYEPTIWYILERKSAHVIEYAVLTLLSLQVFSLLFSKESLQRIIVLSATWAFAYAALDELHQFFTPFRGAHVRDIFIDIFGISLALLFVLLLKKRKTKKTR